MWEVLVQNTYSKVMKAADLVALQTEILFDAFIY